MFVVKNKDGEIVRAMKKFKVPSRLQEGEYIEEALIKNPDYKEGENQEFIPSKLSLPLNWYDVQTRPDFLEIHDHNVISLKAGKYDKNLIFKVKPKWTSEKLDLLFEARYTEHMVVKNDIERLELKGVLTDDDCQSVLGMTIKPEAVNKSFKKKITVTIDDQKYDLQFANGKAKLEDYQYNKRHLIQPLIILDNYHIQLEDFQFPQSLVDLHILRSNRDVLLEDCDPLVIRHIMQQQSNKETDLTEDQYQELLEYAQQLRDLPKANTAFPAKPDFIF